MSLFLLILLVVFFVYAIALVLVNNAEIAVNLLFSSIPSTNLGLVLILTISLGVLIGILLSLLLFKVFQNKLEIRKLKKDISSLEERLLQSNIALEKERQLSAVIAQPVDVVVNDTNHDTNQGVNP